MSGTTGGNRSPLAPLLLPEAEAWPPPIAPPPAGGFGVGLVVVTRARGVVARPDVILFVVRVELYGPLLLIGSRAGAENLLLQLALSDPASGHRQSDGR